MKKAIHKQESKLGERLREAVFIPTDKTEGVTEKREKDSTNRWEREKGF